MPSVSMTLTPGGTVDLAARAHRDDALAGDEHDAVVDGRPFVAVDHLAADQCQGGACRRGRRRRCRKKVRRAKGNRDGGGRRDRPAKRAIHRRAG